MTSDLQPSDSAKTSSNKPTSSPLSIDNSPARVLIVDDHAIVRYGMGVLLSQANDLALCGEADTYDEALTAICELKPDVAVIDIILHDQSGLDLIREIRKREGIRLEALGFRKNIENGEQKSEVGNHQSEIPSSIPPQASSLTPNAFSPPLPILVLSMHNESTHAEKAIRAGAQGYIMKEDADEVLVEALHTVLSGKYFVSDDVSQKMLHATLDEEATGVESLTAREKEVFQCLGKGLTTREMAE